MISILTFLVPCLFALGFAFRGGQDRPRTPRDLAICLAWTLGWCFGAVALWHGLWMSAVALQGDRGTLSAAFYWAVVSAVFWGPVLVIGYLAIARRAIRREDRL